MFTDENMLLFYVKNFLLTNCDVNKYNKEVFSRKKIKCYLKFDENNCFTIYDKNFSIKCIFKENLLEDYFKKLPSYIKREELDSKLKN
jgi:hypothetical protein